MREAIGAISLVAAAIVTAGTAAAQPAPADVPASVAQAADRLVPVLAGTTAPGEVFTSAFLAQVPAAQFNAISAQLRTRHGAPQSVEGISGGVEGGGYVVRFGYERAIVSMQMYVAPDGRVAGLLITGIAPRGDSLTAVGTDFAALPGSVSWGVYRLTDRGQQRVAGTDDETPRAIASSFKLIVLGALDEEVRAGRRRWDEVAPLGPDVQGSATNGWPDGAPMTLHSLAALMIEQSDNRTTDTLLHLIGRERVERFARARDALGGRYAYPLLSTIEVTALKAPALADLRARWEAGNEGERRRLLRDHASQLNSNTADYGALGDGPQSIETVEWFASPRQMAGLLGWFATRASPTARAILSINPGISPVTAARFAEVGYKGGSEPGVIAMNLMMQDSAGSWTILTAAWNDPAAPVDDQRFVELVDRAAALSASAPPPAP